MDVKDTLYQIEFDEMEKQIRMNVSEEEVHVEVAHEGTVSEVMERSKNPKPLTEEIKKQILLNHEIFN